MSVGIMESLFHKTEDEYLQCKNNIFEELINFVHLSEDIKKFHIMIVQYQDAPFKNLQFIHTVENILSALLFEQNVIRDNITKLKLKLKECKKIIKEQRKNLNE
jgi:hypothetical protein